MQKLLFLTIVSVLTCCSVYHSENSIKQNHNPNITDISVYQPEPVDIKTLFSEIGFIKLDASANAFIGSISALRVYKDRIYILDGGPPESVLMFDLSGKFIKRIGVIGRGPKELLTMKHIEIDYIRDRLYITDNYGYQSMAFDLEGNYLFTVPLGDPGGVTAITSSGNIVHECSRSSFGFDVKTMTQKENIKILDTLGNLLVKGFYHHYNRRIMISFKTLSVNKMGDVTFMPMFRDTIYSVTESSIIPLYAFDFSKVKGITKKISDTYSHWNDLTTDLEKNGFVCLSGHLDTPEFLYAQLSFFVDKSHLFYDKNTKATHIVKLYRYTFDGNGYLPTNNITLFNGSSSALIPYSIDDFNEGYFYGSFNEIQQIILKKLNPEKGTIERTLLDSMDPNGSDTFIIYFKF